MEFAVDLIAYLFGSVLFTGVGLLAELQGIQSIVAGETVLGLWLAAVGALLLYAGAYALGYERLFSRASDT